MLLTLAILRWISISVWVAIVIRLAPDARRALRDERQTMDPIWAILWGAAVNRILFVSRDIYYHPDPGIIETGVLMVMYMMASALAGGILKLRGWYGD